METQRKTFQGRRQLIAHYFMWDSGQPAVAQAGGVRAAGLFAGSYLAVWAAAGTGVYAAYRPHGTLAAGLVAITAGIYEFTPLKKHFRRRCRDNARSGLGFGLCCAGSGHDPVHPHRRGQLLTKQADCDLRDGIWDDHEIPSLARIADAIHSGGALAGIELAHNGLNAPNLYSREIPLALGNG